MLDKMENRDKNIERMPAKSHNMKTMQVKKPLEIGLPVPMNLQATFRRQFSGQVQVIMDR